VVPDLLGWDRKKSRTRAAELLELVGMQPSTFLDRYPRELSGGQQQRVGVIRALAADPPVMLMDEPFGAIDPISREAIQDEFLRMQQTLRKTIIFVSHDIDEAVKMADKIAIFRSGRLEQFSSPEKLLAAPANGFIEDFLGTDRALKRLKLVRVADAMLAGLEPLPSDAPFSRASEVMRLSSAPAAVTVDENGRPAGLVSDSGGKDGDTVADHAKPIRAVVPVTTDLRNAVALMFANDMPVLPCVDGDGRLKGILTWRSIVKSLSSVEGQAGADA
jgi:osmoprotectant transport system ATP-binding protein